MKYFDIYAFIMHKPNNLQISDSGIVDKLIDAMNLHCNKQQLGTIITHLRDKWRKSYSSMARFEEKNKKWLQSHVPEDLNVTPIPIGRPVKANFDDYSTKTKKHKISHLTEMYSASALQFASEIKRRKENPIEKTSKKDGRMSKDEALCLLLDARLTKASYQIIRNQAVEKGVDIYPPYNDVRDAKLLCYPADITVSDFSAEIKLQALVDHTAKRICKAQYDVLCTEGTPDRLSLRYKIGFDGATGQSIYKQISQGTVTRNLNNEQALFITCLVPLDLCGFKNGKRYPAWRNPRPSSTMYCRPLRFKFEKETTAVSKSEEDLIRLEISNLQDTEVDINNKKIKIHHIIQITMIDGKVHTALSDVTNSSQCCTICGASPKGMNDIEKMVLKKGITGSYSFGLSSLHAWIRFFECLLHIGYKMTLKKWQAKTVEDKFKVKALKQQIQNRFKDEMGLIVDVPKSGGSGTSNDGNTARRAFQNAEKFAEILNIDVELILNLHIILTTISCGLDIDTDKFEAFCLKTARLYVHHYPWYYMPQSLHKILIHGSEIIKTLALPIGMYSEEAQEARNKDFQNYREHFTRKTSRVKTNQDLLNRLLCTSDPFIASLRKTAGSHTKTKNLPAGVIDLLRSSTDDISL